MSNEQPSTPPTSPAPVAAAATGLTSPEQQGAPGKLQQIEHFANNPDKTELEKWAVDAYKQGQVLMDEQGNRIMLWVSLVLLLLAAIVFYNRTSKVGAESSWHSMFKASNPQNYKEVAETNADSVVGALASVREGESLVFLATENMFKDRETSKKELDDAQKAFERGLKSIHANADVKQRAELGLASIVELKSQGDLGVAIKAYQDVAQKFPGSTIGKIAEDRVKTLQDNPDAAKFYAWFAQQNPKPPVREEPKDAGSSVPMSPDLPGGISLSSGTKDKAADVLAPDFLKNLEKMPKVEGKPDAPKTDTPKPAEPKSEEKPAAVEAKPPVEPKPDMKEAPKPDEVKSETPKPAEPKPAASEKKPEPEAKPETDKKPEPAKADETKPAEKP